MTREKKIVVSLLIQTSRLQALNNSTLMSSSPCFMCPLLPKGALRFTVTHILRGLGMCWVHKGENSEVRNDWRDRQVGKCTLAQCRMISLFNIFTIK